MLERENDLTTDVLTEVHRRKVDEYAGVLAGERPMVPALRAILPQTESEAALAAQLEPLVPLADEVSFYNYGFMALQTLDWIGAVTERGERA